MNQKLNPPEISTFKTFSKISGVVSFAIGVIVLFGWILDIPFLKSLHPALVSMKANTALAIMLAGVSLWFYHALRKSSFNTFAGLSSAVIVAALGSLTLIQYIGKWDFGIDQLLFHEPVGAVGTFIPGRMAVNTAFCFLCLGIALLLVRSKSALSFYLFQLTSLMAGLVALTALIGYFYSMNEFYGYANFTQMALHTGFTLLILSLGTLCAVPDRGLITSISRNDYSGFLIRRLLPASIAIPILIGWLRLEGERHEFFGSAFGVLLVAVVYILLFMILVWYVAKSLNRFDFERKRSEDELRESEDRFEKFMANLPAVVFMKDHENRLLFANPELKELFGWNDAVGKLTSELLPHELAQQMIADDQRVLENGPKIIHEKITDVHGVEHSFETHKFPFYKKNGEVLLGGISIDETKRRHVEEMLRMNEARLESLLKISQHKTESIQELLDFALSEAITLTGSKIGYIYFYDDKKQEFTLNTWSKDVMKECTIVEQQTVYQLGKTGLWGEAVRQKKAIMVNDFQASNPMKKGYPEGHAPLLKYLTIPVISDDRIVAVVGVANKETDYDEADVRQLTLLMDTVWQIAERKRAEDELHKLSLAVEQSPASIVITDTTGAIEYVNPKFIQLTGYSFKEALGNNPRILKSGEKKSEEYVQLWDTITSGNEWRGEFHNKKKNGELYWESAVISPIKDVYSRITHFLAVKEDITDQKQAEEALRISEEKFRAIFENNSSAIAIIEPDTTISLVNDAYCQMSGYTKQEVIGLSWTKQIPADDLDRLKEYNRRRLINPEDAPDHYEFKFYHKNGEARHALMSVAMIQSNRKIITSFTDITDRKRIEEALHTSQDQIHLLLNSTAEAIYGIDLQGNCTFCNNACLQMLGYDHPDELLGKNMHWKIHSKHADGTPYPLEECRIFKAFQKGENSHVDDEVLWRADGTWFPAEYWSYPQRRDGRVFGSVVTFFNISERKRAEDEREKLIHDLQKALADIKTLGGLIPICSSCKKIRDDKGYWNILEAYITEHSDAQFTHGLCPECALKLYPNYKATQPKKT
jgi:PAS domain S-box-containing protein